MSFFKNFWWWLKAAWEPLEGSEPPQFSIDAAQRTHYPDKERPDVFMEMGPVDINIEEISEMLTKAQQDELAEAIDFQSLLRASDQREANRLREAHEKLMSDSRAQRRRVRAIVCKKQGGHWPGVGITTAVGFCVACHTKIPDDVEEGA